MKKSEHLKKMNKVKLNGFIEYKTLTFSMGATIMLALIFLFFGYDFITGEAKKGMLIIGAVYLFMSFFMYAVSRKVRQELLSKSEISLASRRLGWPMVLFIITGNIFGSIAGLYLVGHKKCIEYQLCVFMMINTAMVTIVSALNYFKPETPPRFWLGMGLLLIIEIFYVFVTLMVVKHVDEKEIDPKMKYLLIPLVLTTATGNFFALILAITIFKRIHQKNKEISIEWINIMRRLFRNYMAVIGLLVVTFLFSISICSSLTFDYSVAIDNDYNALFLSPSLQYPFGTDNFGRCIFARIVFGARISLTVGVTAIAIPVVIGGILGALAGYYSNVVDNVIMRVLDIFYAVPAILLAIAIIASFGASTMTLIMAISVYGIPVYARLVRATVLSITHYEYIEAAKACGATNGVIIFKHIIPNSLAPVIVRATLEIGTAVLSTSGLSYLGIGIPSHIPEWGNLLRAGSSYLEGYPYMAIIPGLAIILIVLAFNFFGDGLRDALDPKMK